MARINIEDDLMKDARFVELIQVLGDYERALGAMVRLWTVAQRYWKKDKSLIPETEWKKQRINNALLEVGLAVKKEHGYYASGSEKQFAWLLQRVESGRKGAAASNKSEKRKNNRLRSSETQRSPSGFQPPSPSPSLSPSLSQTLDHSHNTKTLTATASLAAASNKPANDPIANKRVKQAYVECYQERYGITPLSNAKFNSVVASLVKLVGSETAVDLVKFYLKHNDGFYLKNTHSIGLCLRDCESLRTQMLRGKAITSQDVRRAEKAIATRTMIEEADEGGF